MAKCKVKIGIIGGTGLDDPDILENRKETSVTTPFGNPSDVLIEGKIDGVDCVLLARHGRKHTIKPSSVNYRANIWALKEVGCTHVLASTACGSLREEIKPGDFVLLGSFIDRTTSRVQTFYDGAPNSPPGVCHIPMEPAYCPFMPKLVSESAQALKLKIHPGVTCVVIEGPRYSSLAESKMYRFLGGDVINMTNIPEVVLAKEAGLCYAAIGLITDYDCWRDTGNKVCVDEVMHTFKSNVQNLIALLKHVIPVIANEEWDKVIESLKESVKSSVMLPS
ncbi:S-methyl-5'-thioadenosine phosphorylase [Cryptotermes secundus]|uniref:S-methyl-5'-thioadenosine phosphorylase n=1 Tax=Cryptotermes secundus TaxID=105785 RepID=A0A2J7RHD9_9NEOP|nr:S-methyl-5'-thioadenosine phosphorylase [Cryptotermes secundus]PNF40251.1 S-methyl-5'-thioadenosine phosphorylase [Cryptotermes secundus]